MSMDTASEECNMSIADNDATRVQFLKDSIDPSTTWDTLHVTSATTVTQLLISDQDYATLVIIFCSIFGVITFAGCLGNAVTIATYLSMKLKDGVTISFLGLAISDFLYVITMLAHLISLGLYTLERKSSFKIWFPFDPFGIYVFFSNIGVLIYLITIMATTFIAIIRCLCVSMPLQFRNLLTRRRSIWCITIFSLVSVVSYLPILLNMTMQRSFDANINTTRYRLWVSPYREEIKMAIWISRDVLVTFITEVIVIVCVVVMTKKLQAAAKFRNKTAKYSVRPTLSPVAVAGIQATSLVRDSKIATIVNCEPSETQSNKLSSKDFSVVRQVVLISSVYIVCNMPKIVIDLAVLFVPDLALGRPYQNVYITVLGIMELLQVFNSSFNIFIYFKYNSKFRKHLCLFKSKT
ncbi:neurotensin receptor type 2-like [Biomphalaria glabrata]|uniref:Neurotensin receptor type 2-like n=1 Tax=Biomphalaria glabrata TaxID=6526 RepID=A0A9U8EBN2_BIOGL|nr:neurotensin receptor type 2-like [Biomphalaria glabrata]